MKNKFFYAGITLKDGAAMQANIHEGVSPEWMVQAE